MNKRSRNYENSMKIANKFSRCLAALEFLPCVRFTLCIMFTFLWPPAAVRCNNYTSESTAQQKQSAKATKHEKNSLISAYNLNISLLKHCPFLEASQLRHLARKKSNQKKKRKKKNCGSCGFLYTFHNLRISLILFLVLVERQALTSDCQ